MSRKLFGDKEPPTTELVWGSRERNIETLRLHGIVHKAKNALDGSIGEGWDYSQGPKLSGRDINDGIRYMQTTPTLPYEKLTQKR